MASYFAISGLNSKTVELYIQLGSIKVDIREQSPYGLHPQCLGLAMYYSLCIF